MIRAVVLAGLFSSIPVAFLAACSNSSSRGNSLSGDASAETGGPAADGSSTEPDATSHPGSDAASGDSGTEAAPSAQDGGSPEAAVASDASDAGEDAAADAGTGAQAEDAGDGGPCTEPLYWSAVTPVISAASSAPTQTGGMLVSGTYYLTSMTYYNATSACEETLSIMMTVDVADGGTSGTMTELSKATVGMSTARSCFMGTFQTSSDTMVRTTPGSSMTDLYTASPTEFTLIEGVDAGSGGSCEPTSMTFTLTF